MTEATDLQKFGALHADNLFRQKLDEFLLLREMNHRFANTLMALTGVLRREFEQPPPYFQDALARLETQILAFGKLHKSLLIGAGKNWTSVRYYMEHLCKALSDAVLKPLGLTCEVSVDAGELPSERCELLGLVIAELVTNAAKHAFYRGCNGVIRVELLKKNDAWLCLVSDNGGGIGTTVPGVGSKIIEQLVRTMGGHFVRKSSPSGTSIAVTCPVAEPRGGYGGRTNLIVAS